MRCHQLDRKIGLHEQHRQQCKGQRNLTGQGIGGEAA